MQNKIYFCRHKCESYYEKKYTFYFIIIVDFKILKHKKRKIQYDDLDAKSVHYYISELTKIIFFYNGDPVG